MIKAHQMTALPTGLNPVPHENETQMISNRLSLKVPAARKQKGLKILTHCLMSKGDNSVSVPLGPQVTGQADILTSLLLKML